jgi:hypothetical protein
MKFIFLVLFFWVSQSLFCQYNLDFSQVKLVSVQETVPANKVWKIESVIYNIPQTSSGVQTSNGSCTSGSYESTAILVDGTSTKVGNGTVPAAYSNVTNTHSYTSLPFWIPAGTKLSGGTCLNKISIIEFNIQP